MTTAGLRQALQAAIEDNKPKLNGLCQALVRIDSQNPPGDTRPIVAFIERWIAELAGVEVERVSARAPATNLVIRLPMARPGPRLVFNGHLDTFPIGDARAWRADPLAAEIHDGRLYGRGANDMKAGVAVALMSLALLTRYRTQLAGELVLTLVADEESGGRWGTEHLLNHVDAARGDAMISGDVGSPLYVHVGEKGQLWLRVTATGRQAHGAYVHLGHNAIDRLRRALDRIDGVRDLSVSLPQALRRALEHATAGIDAEEARVLTAVTVNIGTIAGGRAINLVAAQASAELDIRFPPGLSAATVIAEVRRRSADLEGIDVEILKSCDATWTDPDTPVARITAANASAATGTAVTPNMRIGFSDARYYRLAGIPSVVYGVTPHAMGAPDEYVVLDELATLLEVHTLSAFDFLSGAHD